jgi:hypothetical protein
MAHILFLSERPEQRPSLRRVIHDEYGIDLKTARPIRLLEF